jgi:hypothetical protein
MKIVALTKFKHGLLFDALQKLGWNQMTLAQKAKLSLPQMSDIINLKVAPTEQQAKRLQRVLGRNGIYLDVEAAWPKGFRGIGTKNHLTLVSRMEVDPAGIIEATMRPQLPPDQSFIEATEGTDAQFRAAQLMDKADLTDLERSAVELRFGFRTGGKGVSYHQAALTINVKPKAVDNAMIRAFAKIKKVADKIP